MASSSDGLNPASGRSFLDELAKSNSELHKHLIQNGVAGLLDHLGELVTIEQPKKKRKKAWRRQRRP
jgi:hypothetical protein